MILIGIFVAALAIFNLDAILDLGRDEIVLVAILADASGVRVGTPVRVAGVQSGRVLGVGFVPAGDSTEVALTVSIDGDARAVLRADSDVRAVRLRVIGQPVVQLEPGSPQAPPVGPGGAMDGVARLRTRLDQVTAALGPALERYAPGGPDAAGELSVALRSLSARVETLRADLDALSLRMEAGGGILYRMAADSALQVAIRGVRAQLDSLRAEGASIALRMMVP